MTKFHIAKTPHQYGGMRYSVLERGGVILNEVCRCSCLSDASLVMDALNQAAKDHETWQAMLAKASTAFAKMERRKERKAPQHASV